MDLEVERGHNHQREHCGGHEPSDHHHGQRSLDLDTLQRHHQQRQQAERRGSCGQQLRADADAAAAAQSARLLVDSVTLGLRFSRIAAGTFVSTVGAGDAFRGYNRLLEQSRDHL